MAKITGRLEVLLNGKMLLNKAGATASGIGISGQQNVEKEAILGDTGLHGFKETPVPAIAEVKITDRDDVLLDEIARVNGDGTLIFRTAGGGKVYTMQDATCTGNFKLTGGEGETEVKFVGPYWTESVEAQ